MLKDNGRRTPAEPKEIADIKGKRMVCSVCGETELMNNSQFADAKCSKCGGILTDLGMENASKTTG